MKKIKVLTIFSIGFLALYLLQSCVQEANASEQSIQSVIIWNELQEADNLLAEKKKKIFIDVHTEWCKWCKVMDEKTFSDPTVADYLNQNFYNFKFDAETDKPVHFNGKEYGLVKSGRRSYNQLASELLQGRLGYPSLVVLDEDYNTLEIIKGYKNPQKLLEVLKKVEL